MGLFGHIIIRVYLAMKSKYFVFNLFSYKALRIENDRLNHTKLCCTFSISVTCLSKYKLSAT